MLTATGMALPALAQDRAASAPGDEQVAPPDAGPNSAPVASDRPADPGGDDLHTRIVVSAAGLSRLDMLAGTSVMNGIELQRNLEPQIGDVLARLPGVTSSSFAPGVSRPVLRGFGGERVKVLTDGVGALDASSTSDDHAVSVDPLIAERIEVLRGPAVLLYGSQAIGGAVNVITRRIPPRVPDEPIHVDALVGADSASDKREGGLSVDLPLAGTLAFHVDGSYRNTDDLAVPGYLASDMLRARLLGEADAAAIAGDPETARSLRDAADQRGSLPDSQTETYTLGAGLALFAGASDIGVSADYYDTSYGVPSQPGGEEGGVSIGMERMRVDMRGTLDLGDGFLDEMRTRWGYSDYTHTEFEDGDPGTVFDVEGVEGRVELVQSRRGAWQGSVGAQYSHSDFAVTGDEAFLPANATEAVALFVLQELDFDPVRVEFGGRYEHTGIDARRALGVKRAYDGFSGAIGASYTLNEDSLEDLRLGVNVSRAERAPSAQELFADGPHVATQQYELGDSALDSEASWGAEAYLRGALGPARVSASVYKNWFDGFIYLADTATVIDDLPVFAFRQQDATQWGLEGEVSLPLYEDRAVTFAADLRGDYVRATLEDGTPVPRIPPLSLTGALEAQFEHFDARGEVRWYDEQTRLAPTEAATDGFTMVNLSLAWHPLEGADNFTFIAQADNVFDVEARRHSSFTKDFVPLAGRNFKLSARASF